MTRTPRGPVAQNRRLKEKSLAKGWRGSNSTLTRVISQLILKAFASANRDRKHKKTEFRYLWMTRINGLLRKKNVSLNFSRLFSKISKEESILNRKLLAQISTLDHSSLNVILKILQNKKTQNMQSRRSFQ
uniref:Large ribosomal subunit protein bL20c n=1 Tax=Monsonia marlothii TaxID=163685 RepID=A0A142G6L1_9ROSI|nr:ribosomal protein L20 [Monsonia marlothii]AMQ99509.1 ribosomal protein L20 [Monsonia marlothii]